jgi:hypothetical protein
MTYYFGFDMVFFEKRLDFQDFLKKNTIIKGQKDWIVNINTGFLVFYILLVFFLNNG